MPNYLDMSYFRGIEEPVDVLVKGPNRMDFGNWLIFELNEIGINIEVRFVADSEEWYYKVETESTNDECISLSIANDSVWWQRGYWCNFLGRHWKEPDRIWHPIDTLQEWRGALLGLPSCSTDAEREKKYKTMIRLSDFVAKTIAKRLYDVGSEPSTDNIITLGGKMDWHMLKPMDEDESDTWNASRNILKLYAKKVKSRYRNLVNNVNP